jgi:MscS family membrane protein
VRRPRVAAWFVGTALALVGALVLWNTVIAPGRAGGDAWTGTWDTRWPDRGARIVLRQHGVDVEGDYRLYDGRLVGKATGNRLEGDWIEGARHGHFVFVLGPFRQGFTGRFDNDAWWTGVRAGANEVRPQIQDATPRQALRSFIIAGNLAAAGYPDTMADAEQLLDFGADAATLDARQRLDRTRALFDAVDLTTFSTWALASPGPDDRAITYALAQAGTAVTLPLTLVQQTNGHWRIAAPAPDAMAATDRLLLQRHGGHRPVPDAMLALRSPRDTMRSFVAAMLRRDSGGAARALGTMDLSRIREGYRSDQGLLQAQYMMQVINRVGAWEWQAIPDDQADRQPYLFFVAQPAGQIVIAPQTEGDRTQWRFTADTVASQLRLYIVTAAMPTEQSMPAVVPAAGLFAFRAQLAGISPQLLARSLFAGLENWQILAIVTTILVAIFAIVVVVPLVIRLLGVVLSQLGQPMDEGLQRRLVWPLRLIVIALIWFKLSRRIGMAGPGLPVLDSVMDVVVAVGVAWAGLPIVDAVARGLDGRVSRTTGTLDEILVSLTAGMIKLGLIITVGLAAAHACDVPVEGIVAGLGIGGLAVAFASKETLSNLFGAGILLADRPFRNGDTIAVGDVQGTVEDVGIRSTRIRTMDDTVIVLPNGKLSDALINNYGARRYRLFRTKFSVGYGATLEQLENFTSKLRDLVDTHPAIAEEKTQVGLWQLANDGVDIDLVCYIRAATAAEERAARHELLLQVMRLARDEGVSFTGA